MQNKYNPALLTYEEVRQMTIRSYENLNLLVAYVDQLEMEAKPTQSAEVCIDTPSCLKPTCVLCDACRQIKMIPLSFININFDADLWQM